VKPPAPERAEAAGETTPLSTDRKVDVRGARAAPAVVLVVYHRDGAEARTLEPGRALVVGREPPSDLVVGDPSLSRRHACIKLERGSIVVEDLGSTNGTLVRGRRVERAVLRPGEPITLGAVAACVHFGAPLAPTGDAVGHDAFSAVLEREVTRARYFHEPLVLAVLRAEARGEPAHVSRWCRRVQEGLRAVDVVGLYSDEIVEICMPRTSATEAVARCRALGAGRGFVLRAGVAGVPPAASVGQLLEESLGALRRTDAGEPVVGARETTSTPPGPDDEPVFGSQAMADLCRSVERLAQSPLPVLISGETGVGKEVVARLVHKKSPRRDRPFVCINCGAIPPQLVESTLFGHERGAFTGAEQASPGALGAADGGTLLLDEIGELPLAAQTSLLRALDSGRIARVGAAEEVPVDVRIVAATHRDLDGMCEAGTFRRDLFYRLDALVVKVPPLRERRGDVPLLAGHFLRSAQGRGARAIEGFAEEAARALERYDWPGNVRELRNAVERAFVIARGARIELGDLPARVRKAAGQPPPALPAATGDDAADLRTLLKRYERELILFGLRATGGNQTHAARRLGVPLRTFIHKMRSHRIGRGDYETRE
jgi:DNA-binding NtrC family response regulator